MNQSNQKVKFFTRKFGTKSLKPIVKNRLNHRTRRQKLSGLINNNVKNSSRSISVIMSNKIHSNYYTCLFKFKLFIFGQFSTDFNNLTEKLNVPNN